MKEVQPIRDLNTIEAMKNELLKKGTRNRFMFILGINTGLRISDMLVLQVKDISNKHHLIIKESKTGNLKRFKINSDLFEHIELYTEGMKESDYIFKSTKSSQPIKRVQAYKILNEAAEKLGIGEIGTHTLRKTFGYHFYKRTKDIAMLQQIFNHSAPSITKRYIGIAQDEIDQVIDNFSL